MKRIVLDESHVTALLTLLAARGHAGIAAHHVEALDAVESALDRRELTGLTFRGVYETEATAE